MPILTPTIDNVDPLIAQVVIPPGFYLQQVEVVEQDSASGSV